MERGRQSLVVYGLLLAAWATLVGWQVAEHVGAGRTARAQLIRRADDISTTLGVVLRSQRRFGSVISKERLESALADLLRPGELNGIALLSPAGGVVASAGTLPEAETRAATPSARWDGPTVAVVNLVDLGASVARDLDETNPPVVLSHEEFLAHVPTNRPPPGWGPPGGPTNPPPSAGFTNPSPDHAHPWGGRARFGRPRGLSPEEYRELAQKQGVHSFLIVMSTRSLQAGSRQDAWPRGIIGLLATIAVAGFGLAWWIRGKSSDLQIRLVRASELNVHLKEMNLAAAGLAHETRNPLNIIRGFAQLIVRQPELPPDTRERAQAIVGEADKVTAQLNEFINYSRPRELRRTAVALPAAVHEVVRTLGCDLEEKRITLDVQGDSCAIEADSQLFRQLLFNLLLNAVQAADAGGAITVAARREGSAEASLEIRDDGPGVPAEQRQEIFKPYFTTHQTGTGLGLAVVQQIVRAHGWEIACLPNAPKGAIFRLSHLKLAART